MDIYKNIFILLLVLITGCSGGGSRSERLVSDESGGEQTDISQEEVCSSVDLPDGETLRIEGESSISLAENNSSFFYTVESNISGKCGYKYSISGADKDVFLIDEDNGQLKFNGSPNWESPVDYNKDNVYELTLVVEGQSQKDFLEIIVMVENITEPPYISSGDSATYIVRNDVIQAGTSITQFDAWIDNWYKNSNDEIIGRVDRIEQFSIEEKYQDLFYIGRPLGTYGFRNHLLLKTDIKKENYIDLLGDGILEMEISIIHPDIVGKHSFTLNFEFDSDGDNVGYFEDAFPNDVAASEDTDGDGFPDSWNPSFIESGSTTGLELDFFPNDVECWNLEHQAEQGGCNYGHTQTSFDADRAYIDSNGVINMVDSQKRLIYRWSIEQERYIKAFNINGSAVLGGLYPEYSFHNDKLYFFSNTAGDIDFIELASGTQSNLITGFSYLTRLARVKSGIKTMFVNDSYIWLHTDEYTQVLLENRETEYKNAINPGNYRGFTAKKFFLASSDNEVYFLANGSFDGSRLWNSSYDASSEGISYSATPRLDRNDPLYDEELTAALFSPDGSTILLSNGNTYSQALSVNQKVVDPFEIGVWMPNGEIVLVRENVVSKYNADGAQRLGLIEFTSNVIGVFNHGDELVIVAEADSGFSFHKNPVFQN